jgi:tetratricopeptide (TPR) repeat protein
VDYAKALKLFQRFAMTLNVVTTTGSIGMVYQYWERYDRALDFYQQALQLAETIGAQDQILTNLRSIASIHQGQGDYELAIDFYRRSLELARRLGRRSDVAINLDGLGTVYFEWRQLDQALAEAQDIGKQDEISTQALETYLRALDMTRATGARADEATVLNNLGTLYLN